MFNRAQNTKTEPRSFVIIPVVFCSVLLRIFSGENPSCGWSGPSLQLGGGVWLGLLEAGGEVAQGWPGGWKSPINYRGRGSSGAVWWLAADGLGCSRVNIPIAMKLIAWLAKWLGSAQTHCARRCSARPRITSVEHSLRRTRGVYAFFLLTNTSQCKFQKCYATCSTL